MQLTPRPNPTAAQTRAIEHAAELIRSNAPGIMGVLVPSFLLSGRQDLHPDVSRPPEARAAAASHGAARAYGMSVTEPCMDWASTEQALEALAAAVRARRAVRSAKRPRHA